MHLKLEGKLPPPGSAATFRCVSSAVEREYWTDEAHLYLVQTFVGEDARFTRWIAWDDKRQRLSVIMEDIQERNIVLGEAKALGVSVKIGVEKGLHDLARAYARRKSCRMARVRDCADGPVMLLAQIAGKQTRVQGSRTTEGTPIVGRIEATTEGEAQ